MSEYWKSTPSYWCKFCSQYVRDTSLERKNHEASAKHQNNIQRSLRQLHKDKAIEERDKQRAKDEVARLNGMFGDGKKSSTTKQPSGPVPKTTSTGPQMSTAAQRKAHAEQLAALGVELPDELKKEVTGVGNYQVVNERAVEASEGGSVSVNRSLAEILAESKREAEVKEEDEVKTEENLKATAKGVYTRKAEEDEEDIRDEEAAPKRKAWGSNFRTYPGAKDTEEDAGDLDALLSGVKRKREPEVKPEVTADGEAVKEEERDDASRSMKTVPDISGTGDATVKDEGTSAAAAAPAVVFKKRKGKK